MTRGLLSNHHGWMIEPRPSLPRPGREVFSWEPPTNRPRQPAARDTSSSSAGVGGGLSGSAAECQKGQRGTFSAHRRQRLKDAVGRRSDILPHGAVEEPLLQATPTATQPSIQQLAMPHLSVSGHAPGSCTTSLPSNRWAVPSLSGASSCQSHHLPMTPHSPSPGDRKSVV